ncbi:DUF6252 family protein [Winogradskyella bathintestinalis]|uniref:DUF6252 family protein n=1 Tax=Winogradskyella bathintestinalis TaxID=3035208 RepID=A0ABT7ZSF1_9FLAO|nr:DUF6252 family protein [Winogradskyella bathintestinalis]MDN3491915.1 DUF6252 family protein [Winogradskyella bathintestinalis]
MKNQFLNITKTILVALFISMTFVSCSSDDSDAPDADGGGDVEFFARVNDGQFTADDVIAIGSVGVDFLSITATKDNGEHVDITIPSIELGTYTASGDTDTQVISTYKTSNPDAASSTYTAMQGSFIITSSEQISTSMRNIQGTFFFTYTRVDTSEVYEFTDGEFNIDVLYF